MELNKLFKNLIKVIIFLTLFQYGLFEIHGNRYLNEIDDVLLILLFVTLLIMKFAMKKDVVQTKKSRYGIIILLLIVWGTLSSALNQAPFINYIVGLKNYFLPMFLIYCIL